MEVENKTLLIAPCPPTNSRGKTRQIHVSGAHTNDDTSWLLTFKTSADAKPFHLLIDPWLSGSQIDYVPFFSQQWHVDPPAYPSISELEKQRGIKVSAILLSHEFTDHAHEATLRTARSDTPVFVQPHGKARLDGWQIFDEAAAPIRIYSNDDSIALPESLRSLGHAAGWTDLMIDKLSDDIGVLYVPTESWLDVAGGRLHGMTVLTFETTTEAEGKQTYSVFYSPHGVPVSALKPVMDALNALDRHQCLALIQSWDAITLPLMGQVNLGKEVGSDVVAAMHPKYWIRTHDELKQKSGIVGRTLRRVREDTASVQAIIGDSTTALMIANGASLQLL